MGPNARALYDRFEQMIAGVRRVTTSRPPKHALHFLALSGLQDHEIDRKSEMVCSFAPRAPLKSVRILKAEEIIAEVVDSRLRESPTRRELRMAR